MSTISAGQKIAGHAKSSSASGPAGAAFQVVPGSGSGFAAQGAGSSSESKTLGLKNECLKSRSPYVCSTD